MKKLIFLILFTSTFCFSQERAIFFGKIFDNLGTLENVHIINLNTHTATYTNPKGEFKLFAKVNDSLKITSVGYKTKSLILKSSDFGITEKQIHLKKQVIELDEVNIKKNNLLGSLSSDIKNIKPKKEINAETLKLPNAKNRKLTVAERRLFTAYGGGQLSLDVVINLLSGRIKKLKALKKIEDDEKQITYLKNTFKKYVIQNLGIDSTDVSRFMYYTQKDKEYEKAKQQGDFAIIKFLKEKSFKFKKLNKKE